MSFNDSWAELTGNQLWAISKDGSYYSEVTETLNSKGIDIGSGSIIQQYRSSGGVLYTFEYASTEVGFIVSKIIIGGEGK